MLTNNNIVKIHVDTPYSDLCLGTLKGGVVCCQICRPQETERGLFSAPVSK